MNKNVKLFFERGAYPAIPRVFGYMASGHSDCPKKEKAGYQ